MIFYPLKLDGAYLIVPRPVADERGFFARAWCEQEFRSRGLNAELAQCNLAFNRLKGTLRGLHFQTSPRAEAKLVRCTQGAIFDVVVDARPGSATFGQWEGLELSSSNRRMVYVPEHCAHGYQTLLDNTEVFYQVSKCHAPSHVRGFRWDDPQVGIRWPMPPTCMSPDDRASRRFQEVVAGFQRPRRSPMALRGAEAGNR